MTRKRPRPRRRRSKTHNLAFAIFFFIVGVIGVLVPIMPQVPFFIMSALFLSLVFPKVRRRLRRWRQRYPKLDASYKKWRSRGRKKRQAAIRAWRDAVAAEKHRPS
ncbi:MAG TPA: DUF454 family protein [Thermoanaerobaculia bacterium]|nr:DUF454 family protein [Thermoanaerobaculia bacterium]